MLDAIVFLVLAAVVGGVPAAEAHLRERRPGVRLKGVQRRLLRRMFESHLHIDEPTLRKRRHGNNATSTVSSRSLFLKLRSRFIFLRSMVDLFGRRHLLKS